jgi:hypothetical protein
MLARSVVREKQRREADIQLQLELMDGDLIIYAEFDKNWYKI